MFWTPEQLSIVNAMHENFMLLIGYYGTGKTKLLIERAKFLLQDPDNSIHFIVDSRG